jgi:hypothetical protein
MRFIFGWSWVSLPVGFITQSGYGKANRERREKESQNYSKAQRPEIGTKAGPKGEAGREKNGVTR